MDCKNCGRRLKIDFVYCPYCGNELERDSFMGFFGDMFEKVFSSLSREMRDMHTKDLPQPRGNVTRRSNENFEETTHDFPGGRIKKIRIKINPQKMMGKDMFQDSESFGEFSLGGRHPREIEEVKKPQPRKKLKQVLKNVVEPNISIKRRANRTYIEVSLPEVKSMNDIDLEELEESIELRAFGNKKTYFKIIKLPPNTQIADAKLENEKLVITLM